MLYTCSFSSIHQGARRRLSRDMACSDNWALEHPVAQSRLDDAYSCQRRVRMGECAPVQQEVHCARSCGRCSLSSSSAAAASLGRPRHGVLEAPLSREAPSTRTRIVPAPHAEQPPPLLPSPTLFTPTSFTPTSAMSTSAMASTASASSESGYVSEACEIGASLSVEKATHEQLRIRVQLDRLAPSLLLRQVLSQVSLRTWTPPLEAPPLLESVARLA